MSLYDEIVPVLSKQLTAMSDWLDRAAAYAAEKKFDPQVLVHARLAPDQWDFARQIRAACDQTKLMAAQISGREPPESPDTDATLEELAARIETARAYLATFSKEDFEGAEDRIVPLLFAPGKAMRATDYLREYRLPNFYFHATTAYAILRHNGVPLGKRDYMGRISLRDL